MEVRCCTRPKRTTPRSVVKTNQTNRESGFTLVELLIAMGLLVIVLTIAFNAFVSSNKLVEADTGRIMASQNVQTALDVLAADVRQAGENLELNLGISGIEFDDAANTITVRRSIPSLSTGVSLARLPLCSKSGPTLQVVGPPPGSTTTAARCAYSDGDGDGEHDNIGPWRTYFTLQEGRPQAALLYRPRSGSTPALVRRTSVRRVEAQTTQTITGGVQLRRVNVTLDENVPNEFTAANNSLLVLIDERRYVLVNDELRLALGGQTNAEAQPVAFDVTDLALSATLGNPDETVSSMVLTGPWARVKSVSLGLTAKSAGQGSARARTYQTAVFPRNVETARSTNAGAP